MPMDVLIINSTTSIKLPLQKIKKNKINKVTTEKAASKCSQIDFQVKLWN